MGIFYTQAKADIIITSTIKIMLDENKYISQRENDHLIPKLFFAMSYNYSPTLTFAK